VYLESDNVVSYWDEFDILHWWNEHKLKYFILSIMSNNIMVIHVPITSLKSTFSLNGRIIEERQQ
jgi:selenophosphate synthetase-related protein